MAHQEAAASAEPRKLSDALYVGFVDELLVEIKWLVVYGAAITATGVIVAVAVGGVALWTYALLIPFATFVRFIIMKWHSHNRPSINVKRASKHEAAYAVGVIAFTAVLSTWTLVTFCLTDDAFARVLTFSATIAYTFGMLARSFAIDKGQNAQIAAGFAPLAVAMLVAGGLYPLLIVFLLIPLFLSIKASSIRLKEVFRREVEARSHAATLADRLDTALNNMPHGLCMIDGGGNIVLANSRVLPLLGLSDNELAVNPNVRDILVQIGKIGNCEEEIIQELSSALVGEWNQRRDLTISLETVRGQAVEVTIHQMGEKGAVIIVQDITVRRDAERSIDRLAYFDSVTSLPNRRFFERELAGALLNDPPNGETTVLIVDLDNFKQVNDSLGHGCGDALLSIIAERLRVAVGSVGLVARWGGDEFTILLNTAKSEELSNLTGRILSEVERPVVVASNEIVVGASIGSASAPADGHSANALLSGADMALYAAKAAGRRGWRAFEVYMDKEVHIRRLIELDLRLAVASDAIDVHYQPIVNVSTSKVVSFEALARWFHPTRGKMSPADFIPIVETLGLMNEMGTNVLRRACSACASWPKGIRVSVNVSPSQLRAGKFVETVQDALRAADLDSDRLEIEITESALLDDDGAASVALQALRSIGVRISLDDFGTGYSSLSYLQNISFDRIKIDRSFIIGLGIQERSSILVESVALMGSRLGMSVLAEGVETRWQLNVIERIGLISEVQGFLFSAAIPANQAGELLTQCWRTEAA